MSKQNLSILSSKQNMFLIKCIVMLLFVVAFVAHLIPQYEDSYNSALNDKVERLCSIEGPKIVLIGNSNLTFGINSEIIEQDMGMPVVNMGLHGGLGNLFHDNMIDYNVHEGDIYVVAHTNYYNEGKIESYVTAWGTVENHAKLWHLIKPEEYTSMIKSFPAYIKKCVNNHNSLRDMEIDTGIYSRASFNEYGDIAVNREHRSDADNLDVWAPVVDDSEISVLNKWNQYLSERGAKMVVAGYPIYYDNLPVDDSYMDEFQKQLQNALDCPVISNWRDYAYPTEYFYNTEYHLTSEGADIRTHQLVEDLKAWEQKQDN